MPSPPTAPGTVLEVTDKVGRHFWRGAGGHLEPEAWGRVPDRAGLGPGPEAGAHEPLAAVRGAVAEELTPRQRRVFAALVLDEVPLDALAVELHTNRNALYKTLFDSRRKPRAALDAKGLES